MYHSLHSSPLYRNQFVVHKQDGLGQFFIFDLSCNLMRTKTGFYQEFGSKFCFPYYFFNNLDSFDECAQDVFLDENHCYLVRWVDYDVLLKDCAESDRIAIFEILDHMLNSWNSVRDEGKAFEQQAVPLRFIFV